MEKIIVSNINYLGIDENFPVPGVDNSSEGFRKNFGVIKDSLREAKTELEDLANNAVRIDQANDLNGNNILNANLISPTAKVFNGGEVGINTEVLFANGSYQIFTITNNLTLSFKNFPSGSKYGVVRLALKGVNKIVSFSATSSSIFYDNSFPTTLVVSSATNPEIIEVWYQDTVGFFLKYLGNFNTVRTGGGESEYDAAPIILDPNTGFISDIYIYQRNSLAVDLTANRADPIIYRVDKLRKVDNAEELYGEILVDNKSPIVDYLGPDKTQGQFKFAINESNVNILKNTYSYSSLKGSNEGQDPNHVGLVYRAILKEYVPIADIDNSVTPVITAIDSTDWSYQVSLMSIDNLNVGARVRFLNHINGDSYLNSVSGIVDSIDTVAKICTIRYNFEILGEGEGGQLTRENSVVMAKGKIL